MLQGLDAVPWADLEHAYGSAADVPNLLRRLRDSDPKVRTEVLWTLYGNVFHQGTRYSATPYVIPFLIELCANPLVPDRHDLLQFWGHLIVGYFSVQERPTWGDGERLYWYGEPQLSEPDDPFAAELHHIYQESLKGYDLLGQLLASGDIGMQASAAWVFACLPTRADDSVPQLTAHLRDEPSGWVRAAIAFALGELGATTVLHAVLAADPFPAARCMAACQLARIDPSEPLIDPLLHFVAEPIAGYEDIPGAGGKSTGDAAFAISHLPVAVQSRAIPALCARLDHARAFDTIPLVQTLLGVAFQRRATPLSDLTEVQRQVLARMVATEEVWFSGNAISVFTAYGLPSDRETCAQLVGATIVPDHAFQALRSGLAFAEIGFLEKACDHIRTALELDPTVVARAPVPDECWLLCAKAFADEDPARAIAAFQCAIAINPDVSRRVNPTWRLADLLEAHGLDEV